ncbi:MAG: hypothetical protein Q9188_005089, partial [Gyalolechia gomerana]
MSTPEPSLPDHSTPTQAELCIKDSRYFAALQINKDSGDWQKWHDIEADGGIYKIPGWTDSSGQQGLLTAAKEGLAAGKLWIIPNPAAVDQRIFMCSGFCLERDLFVTAKHFLQCLEKSHVAHLQLQDPQAGQVYISIWRKSEAPGPHDPSLRRAFLIEWDEQLDVAIFRLTPEEPPWPRSIDLKQITPAMPDTSRQIFSVGYASSLRTERDMNDFQLYLKSFPMNLLHEGKTADLEQYLALGNPNYEEIFRPNRRALAFGEMLGAVPNTSEGTFYHNIPGWFGLSGSMIGVLGPELQVQIIGIFQGGEVDEEPNRLIAFTEPIVQMIRKALSMP